jgi:hypothetical protein
LQKANLKLKKKILMIIVSCMAPDKMGGWENQMRKRGMLGCILIIVLSQVDCGTSFTKPIL